ncbi:hypothetical protein D9M69_637810 [compost metagenome]
MDVRLVGQAVGEAHDHGGPFLGEAEHARFLTSGRRRQGHAGEDRQGSVRLAIGQQHLHVHGEARAEVVAQAVAVRGVRYCDHTTKARQVVTAAEFGELPLYGAADCVFHRSAIWLPANITEVTRSPGLMIAPGRRPGRAATVALWLPW